MDIRAFHAWLTALGEAWQRGDADARAALFATFSARRETDTGPTSKQVRSLDIVMPQA